MIADGHPTPDGHPPPDGRPTPGGHHEPGASTEWTGESAALHRLLDLGTAELFAERAQQYGGLVVRGRFGRHLLRGPFVDLAAGVSRLRLHLYRADDRRPWPGPDNEGDARLVGLWEQPHVGWVLTLGGVAATERYLGWLVEGGGTSAPQPPPDVGRPREHARKGRSNR